MAFNCNIVNIDIRNALGDLELAVSKNILPEKPASAHYSQMIQKGLSLYRDPLINKLLGNINS
jgi:hypothetical protein